MSQKRETLNLLIFSWFYYKKERESVDNSIKNFDYNKITIMTNMNIVFTFLCIASVTAVDLSKIWTVTCRSEFCKEGLELCITSNCFGARQCKSIIDEYYPACSICANEILDTSQYELVNGNYQLVCDNTDDLHVKACLFYCRVNWYPYGECVRQNNIPICKCGNEDTNINTPISTTTTTSTPFTTLLTTPLTTTITTTTTANTIPNGMVI